MTQHLTWDQISDFMIDGTEARYAQHARECSSCRSEIAKLEGTLTEFRGAVRNWTERVSNVRLETSVVHLDFRRGMYAGNEARAGLSSLAIHAAMVALMLFLGSLKGVQHAVKQAVTLIAPAPPKVKPLEAKSGGGGSPQQAKMELPKPIPRRFVPPAAPVQTKMEVPLALLDYVPTSDPTAIGPLTGVTSLGTGVSFGNSSGGTGTGRDGGNGSGVGVGTGGGSGGGAYKPGTAGLTLPVPLSRPEPQYSEEARKAKWGGTVLLSLVVDETGRTKEIKVVKPLGLGLDEKAIEAVSRWIFKPGMKDGKAVPVLAQVEVTFRLL